MVGLLRELGAGDALLIAGLVHLRLKDDLEAKIFSSIPPWFSI